MRAASALLLGLCLASPMVAFAEDDHVVRQFDLEFGKLRIPVVNGHMGL